VTTRLVIIPLPWKISNLRSILSWSSLVIPHRCQTIWKKKPSFLFQPGNTHARERQLGTVDLLQCSSVTGLLNESNSLSAAFGVTKFVAVFATNLVTLRCSTTDTYLIVNFRRLCFNKQALLKWACWTPKCGLSSTAKCDQSHISDHYEFDNT